MSVPARRSNARSIVRLARISHSNFRTLFHAAKSGMRSMLDDADHREPAMRRFKESAAAILAAMLLASALTLAAVRVGTAEAPRVQSSSARHSAHGQETARQYPPLTSAAEAVAIIPGFPNARFWADSVADFAQVLPNTNGPWLALSGGGADGAFGAGLMVGWTQAGDRPEFSLVTGASAGALAAPFVFAGASYDAELRAAFTSITAGDVFEINRTAQSLFDSWPLKKLIAKHVSSQLLAAVATEHRRGRRLFVITTNLDSGRPVAWDMGVIATKGDENALRLFRDVLLASSSIPAFFPPVRFEVEARGQRFQEVHADGTVNGPFFVAPEDWLTAGGEPLPADRIFVVVNGRLQPEFQVAEPHIASLLGRTFSVALKAAARAQIAILQSAVQRDSRDLEVAYIDESFRKTSHGAFDQSYMRALFDFGVERAKNGTAFGPAARVPGLQASDARQRRQQ
jgi:predicted acylesterase/phospholipase RssA